MPKDLSELARAIKGPIVVTGVNGFIGSSIFRAITKFRNDVFGFSRGMSKRRLDEQHGGSLLHVNLTDTREVENAIGRITPATVFHLATYGAYPAQADIPRIAATNYLGSANLISILSTLDAVSLVSAGTSSEYGENCQAPDEDSVLAPNSYYSASKGAVGTLLKVARVKGDLNSTNLRLYSVYGPLEDTSRLVPTAIRAGLLGRFPKFAAPEISRDFVFIDDVIQAFLKAAVCLESGRANGDFNIGTGVPTSLKAFSETLAEIFSIQEEPVFGTMQNRDWDLANWYSNPTKALSILGWEAETSLESGLRLTSDWVTTLNSSDWKEFSSHG